MVPEGLRYTAEHEWVTAREGDPTVVRVGITDYAQDQLGDVVYVALPTVGASITSGESIAEVESTKSVSEIYAPLDGEVIGVNDALSETPELINSDPYGSGWMMEIRVPRADAVSELLDADAYQQLVEGS
ncbi:glycine cleavage system protein GcvH [Actinomycetospora cinnamomea]|uniref:Glycine cleavage system H protein n=1 Tax=Actinomycetospora cinnamomea TaxID=663609 RepID=A0A2U1EUQ6_9PSEU|nr:glycine cleavage system protein GcvH [Actinomycetospora cinnamomea]PVZ03460.1 glycine cleavage system H protein [Actinomycetospora cinnamomea]